MSRQKQNVVFLCLDALSKGHVGCYGYHRQTTPNLDKFATESTLFLDAYSSGTWTPPAISSLLTGRYPAVPRKMTVEQLDGLHSDTSLTTDNDLFRYSPKDIHLGCPVIDYMKSAYPNMVAQLRVAEYHTYVITSSPFLTYFVRDISESTNVIESQIPPNLVADGRGINISTKLCFDELCSTKLESPFFLFLHATQPHFPYLPEDRFIRFGEHLDLQEKEAYLLENRQSDDDEIVQLRRKVGALLVDDYDDNLVSADFYSGEIFRFLERNHPDTMVFVFSDHGDHFYTDGMWYFQHPTAILGEEMLDISLQIPLIAKVPRWQPGTVETPVKLIDLFPTVMKELGISSPPELDGQHLLEDSGTIKAVCPCLGRAAEKRTSHDAWHISDVPESPPLETTVSTGLTAQDQAMLEERLRLLAFLAVA